MEEVREVKEEARLGEEAVARFVWAKEGRGRPNERQFGVCAAIVTNFRVAYFRLNSASDCYLIGCFWMDFYSFVC